MAKISLILTTKNEEDSIGSLLDSIKNQSVKPDETVIADSCSTDKTIKIINSYKKTLPVKLISQKCNRSEGRNLAISHAQNEIIAATDAGCVLDKNWLKNITAPFTNPRVDVVSGYYKPIISNILDELVYLYTSITPEKLNKKKFLPSSRSVAFRKSVWKEVGGYPQFLDSSEDMYFNLSLKKQNKKFIMTDNAIVFWHPRSPNQTIFKQFYVMAKSSAYGGIIKKSVYLQIFRYLLLTTLLTLNKISIIIILLIFYLLLIIFKHAKYLKNKKAILFLPFFQIYVDLAVISGTITGILKRYDLRRNFD